MEKLNELQIYELENIAKDLGCSVGSLLENLSRKIAADEQFKDEVKDALFYSKEHQQHLTRGVEAVKNGKGIVKDETDIIWYEEAWQDYLYWQKQDKKTLSRINDLLKDIERNGMMNGIGKPEELKGTLTGFYSRRIDACNRIVYTPLDSGFAIISCKGHYKE